MSSAQPLRGPQPGIALEFDDGPFKASFSQSLQRNLAHAARWGIIVESPAAARPATSNDTAPISGPILDRIDMRIEEQIPLLEQVGRA